MRQIDESLANRLADRPQAVEEDRYDTDPMKPILKCPKCGNDMIVKNRKNDQGKYVGCGGFPECKNALWLPQALESIEVLDESCSRVSIFASET
jgi:DNA topoisomerase-3